MANSNNYNWNSSPPGPRLFRELRALTSGTRSNLTAISDALDNCQYARCGPHLAIALDAGEVEQLSIIRTLDDALRRLELLLAKYQGAATADLTADIASSEEEFESNPKTAMSAYWVSVMLDMDED